MSYMPAELLELCFCDGETFRIPPSMYGKLVLLREDRHAKPPFPYQRSGRKPEGVLRAAVAARAKGRGR